MSRHLCPGAGVMGRRAPRLMAGRCEVCAAPVVQADGRCAFCRSPVSGEGDPQELLDYLAERLPGADVRRAAFGHGPVREVRFKGQVTAYGAALKRGVLALEPDVRLREWIEMLVGEVTRVAASDQEVRRGLSRAGWAFR